MSTTSRAVWLGATLLGAATPAFASLPTLPATAPMITTAIDEHNLVTLVGNHPAAANTAVDHGALDSAAVLPHVMMALKRPPALQAAFDKLVAEQTTKGAPNYHKWLKPAELRAFGPAQSDIDHITAWLASHGLTVNGVTPSGMAIDIGGRVADLSAAFHTTPHNIVLKNEAHIATLADASVPAAIAPVVQGVTMSNLFPKPNMIPSKPLYNIPAQGGYPAFQAVVPADFNTIYNVNPLLNGSNLYGVPITGAGQTIAVVEQTNIKAADWKRFRTYFALSGYAGTFTSVHPGNCGNPGFTGDEVEAAIDAEWASAPAPDANIIEASCPGTETTFGVMTTLQNLVELGSTPATIYSISYGGCEAGNGQGFLTEWSNLIEEGAAEGISIMVSSGDSGSSCDGNSIAENGVGVNGLASNPYDTSVGGTDFYDLARNQVKQYWGKNTKPGHGSALSYIPEIPWNNSCANAIVAHYEAQTSGMAYCNEPPVGAVQNGVGGTGGFSVYYAKPTWQPTTLLGMPNDGARDQPDVAMFAANGIWNHFYLICMSDQNEGGAPCKYTGETGGVPNALYQAYGGTSVAAPAFAGIMALMSEVDGVRLGNPAPELYSLAQLQYSDPLTTTKCNASLGRHESTACVFNNITAGDNIEPCAAGTPDCYTNKLSTQGIGILSISSNGKREKAYKANPGYSLATGLGSVNATNLAYVFTP